MRRRARRRRLAERDDDFSFWAVDPDLCWLEWSHEDNVTIGTPSVVALHVSAFQYTNSSINRCVHTYVHVQSFIISLCVVAAGITRLRPLSTEVIRHTNSDSETLCN